MPEGGVPWNSRNVGSQLKINLRKILAAKTAKSLRIGGQKLRDIVAAYRDDLIAPESRAEINQTIADLMHRAIVDSYLERVEGHRVAEPYREGDRLTGKLLDALRDEPIVIADANGIMITGRPLDSVAAHWARLNFGAAGGDGYSGIVYPSRSVFIRFGASQGFSLRWDAAKSPGFHVPEAPAFSGHFNSKGQFFIGFPKRDEETGKFPKKGDDRYTIVRGKYSKGIGARHYMDAGLVAFQQEFVPRYTKFIHDAMQSAIDEVD